MASLSLLGVTTRPLEGCGTRWCVLLLLPRCFRFLDILQSESVTFLTAVYQILVPEFNATLIYLTGPGWQKYLWWKRYLTSMQMLQFLLVFAHCIVPLISSSCGFSIGVNLIIMFNGCLYWFLFLAFYRQTYRSKPSKLDVNGNRKNE